MADIPKYEDTTEVIPSYEDTLPASSQGISSLSTILHQGLQGGTLGFSDEILGALGAAKDVAIGNLPNSESLTDQILKSYQENRDKERALLQQAREEHPYLSFGANVAGGLISPIPGSSTIKGAAALGALTGLGASEAKSVPSALVDVGIGAAGGAIGAKIGQAIGGKLAGAGKKLEEQANENVLDVIGANKALFEKEIEKEAKNVGRESIGKTILEEGLLPIKGSSKEVFKNVNKSIDSLEQTLSPIINKLQPDISSETSKLQPVMEDFYPLIQEKFRDLKLTGKLNRAKSLTEAISPLMNEVQDAQYNLPLLQEIKVKLGKEIGNRKFNVDSSELSDLNEMEKQVFGIIRKRIIDLASEANPDLGSKLATTNNKLSNLYNARDMLLGKVATTSEPKLFDKELAAAGGALLFGHPQVAAAIATKKAAELATGKSTSDLLRTIGAKTQSGLADVANKYITPNAEKITDFTTKALQPSSEAIAKEQHMFEGIKETLDNMREYTPEQLNDMSNKVLLSHGDKQQGKDLSNVLKNLATKDPHRRNALMFTLSQNPEYKRMLSNIKE